MWFATPSSQWTLTTYSLPVSRRTIDVIGAFAFGGLAFGQVERLAVMR
jgi:hypothetical protein